jgi:hypothetical protein
MYGTTPQHPTIFSATPQSPRPERLPVKVRFPDTPIFGDVAARRSLRVRAPWRFLVLVATTAIFQQATDRDRHPPRPEHGAGAAGDPERPPAPSTPVHATAARGAGQGLLRGGRIRLRSLSPANGLTTRFPNDVGAGALRARLESPRVNYATPSHRIGTTRAVRRRQLPTKQCHAALPSTAIRAYQSDSSSKPPLVSEAPARSGNRPCQPGESSDINIDRGIEAAARNRLTVGPSISVRRW